MQKLPLLLKVALIGGAVWVATKIAAALSLQFSPGKISVNGSTVVLGLDILNTSVFPVAYQNLSGEIFINGQSVGTVFNNQEQQIIANGLTHLDLAYVPLPGTLITEILNAVSSGASQQVQLKGTVTAEHIPVTFSETYNTPDVSGIVSALKNIFGQ